MSAGGPNRSALDRLFLEVRSAGAHRRQTLRSWAKESTDVTTICKDQRWEIQKPIDLLARDIRSKNMTKKMNGNQMSWARTRLGSPVTFNRSQTSPMPTPKVSRN